MKILFELVPIEHMIFEEVKDENYSVVTDINEDGDLLGFRVGKIIECEDGFLCDEPEWGAQNFTHFLKRVK